MMFPLSGLQSNAAAFGEILARLASVSEVKPIHLQQKPAEAVIYVHESTFPNSHQRTMELVQNFI